MNEDLQLINRWRLILGKFSEGSLKFSNETLNYVEMDHVLEFLYGREYSEERGVRQGGNDSSVLSAPKWISRVRELFPKHTVEILEKHAIERYHLVELLTNKEVLEKLEPNSELLKSILQLKHLMKGEVLDTARKIVRQVSDDIRKRLEQDIRASVIGKVDKTQRGVIKSARNIDFKRTIRKNLKNYDLEQKHIIYESIYFNQRVKQYNSWNIIIAVDESGSMLDSVIHSAVMAGIFARLPMIKTHLILFDVEVVDVTGYIDDPVETLMSIQLGGGTNIAKALQYSLTLIDNPYRSIVVLITDLCEGGSHDSMYNRARNIIESGAKLIVLTSLDAQAVPVYDKKAAQVLVDMGAHVAALTPEELSQWIANIIS